MVAWQVTFALATGLRTFRVHAESPGAAEDQARMLLVLEAVDTEMVALERAAPTRR